jgi:hypothetical protein
VVVSDQSEDGDPFGRAEVLAVVRVLRLRGHEVRLHRHLPRQGLAEHRQSLLDAVTAPYCLFLDDDVILEPDVVERLHATIVQERCGLVACGLIGPSFEDDVRPDQQAFERWDGPVERELVTPACTAWQRRHLHRAANLLHAQRSLDIPRGTSVRYRLAWASGCAMFDAAKLRDVGGFSFWRDLPGTHAGEDVLAQLRVMERYGGCGIMPSGAFHQEVATTVPVRDVDAPYVLPVVGDAPLDDG